jgi:membrane-associated phospholipid phosphatase
VDSAAFRWFNRLADRTHWAHGLMRWYANNGIVLFAVLLLVAYVHGRHNADVKAVAGAVWAGAAALVALAIGQIIGNIVDRHRPYAALANVHVLIDRTSDVSFPSDHATAVGAVAVGLWFTSRRIGIVAVIGAVFMAFARVYCGAHYPGDVLAGLALGGLVAAAGARWIVPALSRFGTWLTTTPMGPLVTRRAARPSV